jgi:hypothetical protein
MSDNTQRPNGCSEKYAELCAVSTTGELSGDEWADLEAHLDGCAACSSLLGEYDALAHAGMAKLAPDLGAQDEGANVFREKRAELRLTGALHAGRVLVSGPAPPAFGAANEKVAYPAAHPKRWAYAAAAVALVVCCVGGFEAGRLGRPKAVTVGAPLVISPKITPPIAVVALSANEADLKQKLAAAQKSLSEFDARSLESEKEIAELSGARDTLQTQLQTLKNKEDADTTSLIAMIQQRDGLQQQLGDTAKSLERVKQDLDQARQERQGAVLRVASLESDVNRLNATLAITNQSASANETYLAQDRDVRELMGARQLYIADVFDVQNDGQKSKPYGRVFYTKGRSLLFYAFDLETQPGYHETKAFQAWGKPDSSSQRPISLGIFYMDSQSNRRWILKSDNPDVLAQINAVFVTVEPKGGSAKPTGKPFLEAYLHSLPPNHP